MAVYYANLDEAIREVDDDELKQEQTAMGLDMYLYAKEYITSSNEEYNNVREAIQNCLPQDHFPVKYVISEAGYWRKANQIHAWFVKNVQNDVDDCGEYSVSHDQLKRLLTTVNKVLKSKKLAQELLPPMNGFFFGTYDYCEYYFDQLKETRIILKEALSKKYENCDFSYQSSW